MAGYSAVIDVRVQGQDDLRALTDGVGRLNDLIRKVKRVPTLFDDIGTKEVKKLKGELAQLVKEYAVGNTNVAKFSTSISGVAQQLSTFRAIAANAKTGTEDFTNALKAAARASTTLLEKELDRFSALQGIYQRQAVGNLSIQDQGPSKLVRDLIALKNTVPNSVSAMERYQRELLDVQNVVSKTSLEYRELGQAIRQVDVILGRGGQLGPVPPPVQGPALPPNFRPPSPTKPTKPAAGGLQGLMQKPGVADALIGGSFPLLFGGGPGATIGGFAGGLVGGAMNGMAGMALSLALSAVGQQLDAAVAKIRDMQKAIDALDADALRDSFIQVNGELAVTLDRLVDAGKFEEARAAATKAAVKQTGALGTYLADSAKASIALGTAWEEFTGTLSTSITLLSTGFVKALTTVVELLNMAVKGWNLIGTLIGPIIDKVLNLLVPGYAQIKWLIDEINKRLGSTSEAQAKIQAEIQRTVDAQNRQIAVNERLSALESQRTLGRNLAEKQINAALDSQIAKEQIKSDYANKAIELRRQVAAAETEGAKLAAEAALRNNSILEAQALKQQAIKDKLVEQGFAIEANTERYASAANAIELQIAALDRAASVRQSALSAEAALNDLYGAQLDRAYRLATTAQQRYDIAVLQFNQQVNAAQIEYKQAVLNNKLLVDKAALQAKLIQLKYEEIAAEKEIALAQAISRGNTPDQISSIAGAYNKALSLQSQAVKSAYEQVDATRRIAENQNVVAKAVYQTKILQAESALTQKLVSDQIGLSQGQAQVLAANMAAVAAQAFTARSDTNELVGTIQVGINKTQIFARSMSDVAAAANKAANNIRRAFLEQINLNNTQRSKPAPRKAAAGAFWQGGFQAFAQGGVVNRPTLGLIGEGGESEYIVPESKAARFATNYLFGERGASAIPSSTESNSGAPMGAPVINITTGPVVEFNGERYVTVADMERAMRATANGVIGRLRSPSARVALGMV